MQFKFAAEDTDIPEVFLAAMVLVNDDYQLENNAYKKLILKRGIRKLLFLAQIIKNQLTTVLHCKDLKELRHSKF